MHHEFREVNLIRLSDAVNAGFENINPRSATGPDKVGRRRLKECSESIAPVFTAFTHTSFDEGAVPRIWKTSTIVSAAKKRTPKVLNDCWPVVLTSIPFKCDEKMVFG